jgi:hypothetical protein
MALTQGPVVAAMHLQMSEVRCLTDCGDNVLRGRRGMYRETQQRGVLEPRSYEVITATQWVSTFTRQNHFSAAVW